MECSPSSDIRDAHDHASCDLVRSAGCRQSEELDDLPEHGPEGLTKRTLIHRGESAQFLEDKGWVDGGEDGYEDRRFEQARPLPILHLHLTHGEGKGLPTGDCHDEEIEACLMVGLAADHDGGTAFDGGLIHRREGGLERHPQRQYRS